MRDSRLEDDGGSLVAVVDQLAEEGGALWVRVGPVYRDDGIDSKPGIWVNYQPFYMHSALEGPVLVDIETWNALDKVVRERIASFDRKNYA